ncbi:hypothetical protein Q4602_19640 [Paraglaciecola chathamensis]|uniref:hypothetical protein n=1 Tax=Paraglaciecola chathamensis TaxID=368405 RepID=UPI002700B020|nr:hypothetical protein [Paraglaciecola chathamensis]MDO6841704.1 hypothetical protein [Paraglaciecola chathamensis]
MKQLPDDTKQELSLQLQSVLRTNESSNPASAVPENRALSYQFKGGTSFVGGFKSHLLGDNDLSELLFAEVIPNARMGVAENTVSHDNSFQYALFSYALLLGYQDQVDESAAVLLALNIPNDIRFRAPPEFYLMLAHLWRGETDAAIQMLDSIEKLESKKSEFYIQPGLSTLVRGVVNNEPSLMKEGARLLFDKHLHTTKYFRTALENNHYFCEPVTLLTIVGRKLGVDVKANIGDTTAVLKTKTFSPIDRPEIPAKKKFEVPVDLVPPCFLKKRG